MPLTPSQRRALQLRIARYLALLRRGAAARKGAGARVTTRARVAPVRRAPRPPPRPAAPKPVAATPPSYQQSAGYQATAAVLSQIPGGSEIVSVANTLAKTLGLGGPENLPISPQQFQDDAALRQILASQVADIGDLRANFKAMIDKARIGAGLPPVAWDGPAFNPPVPTPAPSGGGGRAARTFMQ